MKLILGSDHAGFELKEYLKKHLRKLKIQFEDLGPFSLNLGDDYPVFAAKVARKVAKNNNLKGVLMCGNAQGVCIAANKINGIRAAVCYDEHTAITSRTDDDANIICLRGRKFSKAKAAKLLKIWLDTPFSKAKRHIRRLNMIRKLGQNG